MGKWFVVIDHEGIQAQVSLGNANAAKAAKEEKSNNKSGKNRAKIIFVFEEERSIDDNWQDKERINDIHDRRIKEFYDRKGTQGYKDLFGYNMRKTTITGKYIEVLADLEANNYSEFNKKYNGLQGAIDVLTNTERIYSATKTPGDEVIKWIKRLQLEMEDE